MLKDFSCVMVGDPFVFNFAGMIRKRNAVTVQRLGKLRVVGDFAPAPKATAFS